MLCTFIPVYGKSRVHEEGTLFAMLPRSLQHVLVHEDENNFCCHALLEGVASSLHIDFCLLKATVEEASANLGQCAVLVHLQEVTANSIS